MALPSHEVKALRLREQIITFPLPENLSITPSPLVTLFIICPKKPPLF